MLEIGQIVEVIINPCNFKNLAYVYASYTDEMNIERFCFKKLDKNLNKTDESLDVLEFDNVELIKIIMEKDIDSDSNEYRENRSSHCEDNDL